MTPPTIVDRSRNDLVLELVKKEVELCKLQADIRGAGVSGQPEGQAGDCG